jgi:acyl-CoA thioester hydrolase
MPDPPLPEGASPWFGRIAPGEDAANNVVAHVSNVEYVRWLDRVGQLHLEELGWPADALLASGAMWFVARHEIDYRREATAGEVLLVATWVRSLRRVKSWRDTIVWRPHEDGEVVCTASTLWVHVNLDTRRPTRPPTEMAEALAPLGRDGDSPWRERA